MLVVSDVVLRPREVEIGKSLLLSLAITEVETTWGDLKDDILNWKIVKDTYVNWKQVKQR